MIPAEVSNLFVVAMGLGTVFLGLICIVFLCMLMSFLCHLGTRKQSSDSAAAKPTAPSTVTAASSAAGGEIPNQSEWIAAVSAAIAEDMGADVSAIRIHSIKRV